MAWVSPTVTVEMEFAGVGGGWTDITADLTMDPIQMEYGIRSHRPEDRLATTGELKYALRNDANNSGAQLGYYSPFHASKRSGFDFGNRTRLKVVYSGDTRYKLGRVSGIIPELGQYGDTRRSFITALDWMDVAARQNAPTALQENKRSDEVFSAMLANVDTQPVATDIQTGQDTYGYALDNISGGTKVISAWADLLRSELGIAGVKRDATGGETLFFEGRQFRQAVSSTLITLDSTMHALDMPGDRADVINVVRCRVTPRYISADIVVAKLDAAASTAIAPGASQTIFLDYTDPTQRDTKIGARNGVPPVVTTDYTMNSAADGSGSDLTADFSVVATFWSSTIKFVVTNNGTVSGFIRTLQARGDGLFSLNPVTGEATGTIGNYGRNVVEIDMTYHSDASVAPRAAQYLATVFSSPLANVRQVSFVANQSAALMTAAVTGDISSRIALVETVSGLTSATLYFINAVRHEIEEFDRLTCTWWLTPASAASFWRLATSALAVDTRLAY